MIYSFIHLFIYLFIHLFIYLFIYFVFNSLCAYVNCKSACVSICKYVFLLFCLNFPVFCVSDSVVFVSLFVCLFVCLDATLLLSLYLVNVFIAVISLILWHNLSCFISYFHQSIGEEFDILSSSGIIYPYPSVVWVSRLREVLIFLFFLFCKG